MAPREAWGGPLGGALGLPWGALWGLEGAVVDPRGIHRDHLLQAGGLAKSMVLPYEWLHFGCHRDLGIIIREEVVDQSWPPKTSRRQRGHPGRGKTAEGSPKRPKGTPKGPKESTPRSGPPSFGALGSVGGPLDMIYQGRKREKGEEGRRKIGRRDVY